MDQKTHQPIYEKAVQYTDSRWGQTFNHEKHRQEIEDLMIWAFELGRKERKCET